MNDDLISRKALLEAMNEIRLNHIQGVEMYIDVVELIRKLPTAFNKGWIPVDKLLPKSRGLYLCTAKCEGERYVIIGHYNGPGWTDDYAGQRVIAWRQLPEPYEPEAN